MRGKTLGHNRLRDQLGHLHEAWKEIIFLLGIFSQWNHFQLDHRREDLDLDSSNENTFLKDNHDHGEGILWFIFEKHKNEYAT